MNDFRKRVRDDLIANRVIVNEVSSSELTGLLSGWIDRKERLPEEGQEVLAWIDRPEGSRQWWQYIATIYRGSHFHAHFEESITHWMPLPKPPAPCKRI